MVTAPIAGGVPRYVGVPSSRALRKVSADVLVTLDVFSGRPNPSWSLTADEEQELARRIQGLPLSGTPPLEGDLGYRGFKLVAPVRDALPREIIVGNGRITIRDDRGTHYYIDRNGLEAWLLEQARRHGHGAFVQGR